MIENLARHIEWLLGENDCVIVPGLGGFIAHYTPARRIEAENRFLPPTRIIAFNPRLKINDGVLVQSYMQMEGVSFAQALNVVERDVEQLLSALHDAGRVVVGRIGELRYSLRGVYSFTPFDNHLEAPALYGLGSFEMLELKVLPTPVQSNSVPANTDTPRTYMHRSAGRLAARLKVKPVRLLNALLVVAVMALCFFIPTPIENTEVVKGNYARLLPEDIFKQFEQQSLAITPIGMKSHSLREAEAISDKDSVKILASVGQVVETSKVEIAAHVHRQAHPAKAASSAKVPQTDDVMSKHYHVIVASMSTAGDARQMASRLVGEGYAHAHAIIADGKKRVCIKSCATEAEAYHYIGTLREAGTFKDAWVLKR